jgi:hypothetical protein
MTAASLRSRPLLALAWANVAAHAIGLVLAAAWMRPGSPVSPLAERIDYLATQPAGWAWGWGIWMLCSLLLAAYTVALEQRLPGAVARLAVALVAAGVAADLLCDVVQIAVLPQAAAASLAGPAGRELFLALEQLAFTGGATVANGLYTTAVLLMSWTVRRSGRSRKAAWACGCATAVSGYAMAAAGLIPSPRLLALATGPTIGFFSLWTLLAARDLEVGAERA